MPLPAPPPPRPAVVNGGVALLCLIWGSTWLVIQEGLADLPPGTALALRFTLATVLFASIVPRLRHLEGGARPGLGLTLTQALFTFALPFGLLYWAETRISSGLAAVLFSIFPVVNALLGRRLLPDEPVSARAWAGFAVASGGLALLFWTDLRELGRPAVVAGGIYLLAPLASAVGNVIVKRHGAGTSSLLLNRDGLALAALFVWPAVLLFERGAEVRFTTTAVLSVLYLASIGTVVTFGLYFWLLRYAPSYKMALIAYVIPAVALLFGAVFAGEEVGATTLLGTALVLGGVAVTARAKAPDPEATRAGTPAEADG